MDEQERERELCKDRGRKESRVALAKASSSPQESSPQERYNGMGP